MELKSLDSLPEEYVETYADLLREALNHKMIFSEGSGCCQTLYECGLRNSEPTAYHRAMALLVYAGYFAMALPLDAYRATYRLTPRAIELAAELRAWAEMADADPLWSHTVPDGPPYAHLETELGVPPEPEDLMFDRTRKP